MTRLLILPVLLLTDFYHNRPQRIMQLLQGA
jgi:hypothetical protein